MNTKEAGKEFLEHHGIRGMKWGVRRTASQLGKGGKKEGDGKEKAVVGKTKTDRGGGAKTMSDATLKRVNNRLQMEQQYAKLTAKPPGAMDKGKKFVEDIVLNVAKTQITKLANEQASKAVDGFMSRKVPKLPTKPLTQLPDITTRYLG